MPVEMTSAATWLGSAHLRLGACAGPPGAAKSVAAQSANPKSQRTQSMSLVSDDDKDTALVALENRLPGRLETAPV